MRWFNHPEYAEGRGEAVTPTGKNMKAIWLENNQISIRKDLPIPEPSPGEALIKTRLSGICATDLELVKGYYPYKGIPGHEFVGEVAAVALGDQAASEWVGKRVVGEINLSCGACEYCCSDHPTHCSNRTVLGIMQKDGVFADYLTLPLRNLHLIPDNVPDEAAVFVEPIAAALEIQEQVHVKPNMNVVVIGAGRLGQLIAQTLSLTGCRLAVLARYPSQQRLLRARNISALSEEELINHGADVVVEATGSPGGFALAMKAVKSRGVIVLKSTYRGKDEINFSTLVVEEISLIGSRCGPFPPAIQLLERRLIDPTPLIEYRYPLEHGLEAFEKAASSGVMKVLIQNHYP